MSNTLYKQTAIEFAKIAFNTTKILAISATALVACMAFFRYIISWDASSAMFGGIILYFVLGSLYCMIDMATHRARMKEKYPDIDFS